MAKKEYLTVYFRSEELYIGIHEHNRSIVGRTDGDLVNIKYKDGKLYEGEVVGRSSKFNRADHLIFVCRPP